MDLISVFYTKNPSGITASAKTRAIQLNTHLTVIYNVMSEGNGKYFDKEIKYISNNLLASITSDYKLNETLKMEFDPKKLFTTFKSNWININNPCSILYRLAVEDRIDLLTRIFNSAIK